MMLTTDRSIATAQPGESGKQKDYPVKGCPGLQLRVSGRGPNITRTWSLLYRKDNRKHRLTIGTYPFLRLAEATQLAVQRRGSIAGGGNPAADARRDRVAETFGDLANLWLDRHAKVKKRSWREDERMLKHDLFPALEHKKASKVTKSDILAVIDGIMDRGSPYQANRVLVLVKTIFQWGIRREIVAVNPAAILDKPSNEEKRTRALSPDEVKRFWHGLDKAPMTEELQIALKLALLTGQRINELGLARRSEFDLAAHLWIVPGRRAMPGTRKESGAKNKADHHLPLTGEAEALLSRAFELGNGSEWLFPSPRPARGVHVGPPPPIGETAISRAYRRAKEGLGLPETRPHDLRRTWSTLAGDLGYDDFEVGLVLNHKTSRGSVTGSVYNQSKYMKQKKQIIEKVQKAILASVK